MIPRFFIAPIFALAVSAAPATLHAQTSAMKEAENTVRAAIDALVAGDLGAVRAKLPPKQLQLLAEAAGTDVETLLASYAQKVADSLEIVDQEYVAVLPGRTQEATTPSGMDYVIVWGVEYWRTDENNLHKLTWPVVAFEDGGAWYFTQTRKVTDTIALRRAYPDFLDVVLPEGKMERVWDNNLPDNLKEAD